MRAAAALYALAVAVLAAAVGQARGDDEVVRIEAVTVALDPNTPERVDVGLARFEAGFVLRAGDPRFGGLSGLLVDPDGTHALAVGDRGTIWRIELVHDQEDRLHSFGEARVWALNHPPFDGSGPAADDAESLAWLAPDGLAIAFEQNHRLRRLPRDDPGAVLEALPTPPDLALAPANQGVEALVELADGRLFAIAEGLFETKDSLRAWLIDGERFERLGYRPGPGFRPTGLDRLGDDVFVLERSLSLLGGWQARVVHVPATDVRPGAMLEGRELLRLRHPFTVDNMEGIAVRRTPDGRVLIYLVSDDNFNVLQRTLLLQFAIDSGPLGLSARTQPRNRRVPSSPGRAAAAAEPWRPWRRDPRSPRSARAGRCRRRRG